MIERQATGRKLRGNHSNALPRYIVAMGVQRVSDQDRGLHPRGVFAFGSCDCMYGRLRDKAIGSVEQRSFTSTLDYWDWLYSLTASNYTTWVISREILSDLILCGFTEQFAQGELSIDWPRSKRIREDNNHDDPHTTGLAVIESPPTIIACRVGKTQGRIVFVDSLNWFPVPIEALAVDGDIGAIPFRRNNNKHTSKRGPFNPQVHITFNAFTKLIAWVRDNNMGMFRYTAPSQAMGAFRHRFMKCDIYYHDNQGVKALERKAYFGGRSEVFRIGDINQPVFQLDVNSLFPSVMRNCLFPACLDRFEPREEYMEIKPDIEWGHSVAEVEIETKYPIYPMRMNDIVTYPVGRFKTVLCGLELKLAARAGIIRRVRAWSEYRMAPLFVEWVDTLWAMRQEYKRLGNKLYDTFTKRLMNSLYGKFAQRSAKWVNVQHSLASVPWSRWHQRNCITGERSEYRSFGWQIQKREEQREISNTFVAISSFITAAARVRMNCIRDIAGKPNVYYQGVDSVIVTRQGKARLWFENEIQPDELGKLRLEWEANEGVIYGTSDYRLGGKTAVSGRSNLCEINADGEIMQRRFYAESRLFNGQYINTLEDQIEPWQRHGLYRKGIVGPAGWVNPMVLNDHETTIGEPTDGTPIRV